MVIRLIALSTPVVCMTVPNAVVGVFTTCCNATTNLEPLLVVQSDTLPVVNIVPMFADAANTLPLVLI